MLAHWRSLGPDNAETPRAIDFSSGPIILRSSVNSFPPSVHGIDSLNLSSPLNLTISVLAPRFLAHVDMLRGNNMLSANAQWPSESPISLSK